MKFIYLLGGFIFFVMLFFLLLLNFGEGFSDMGTMVFAAVMMALGATSLIGVIAWAINLVTKNIGEHSNKGLEVLPQYLAPIDKMVSQKSINNYLGILRYQAVLEGQKILLDFKTVNSQKSSVYNRQFSLQLATIHIPKVKKINLKLNYAQQRTQALTGRKNIKIHQTQEKIYCNPLLMLINEEQKELMPSEKFKEWVLVLVEAAKQEE